MSPNRPVRMRHCAKLEPRARSRTTRRTPSRRLTRLGSRGRSRTSNPAGESLTYSQNFLKRARIVDRILDRSSIGREDVVVEIGPGGGRITERLALRCRHVVAIEKDERLAQRLRLRFSGQPNVIVFEGDFLTFPLPVSRYKVFASIPFNVTAAIVAKLTSSASPPEDMYLGVQLEAAQRFLGRPTEGLASVLLKPWFEPDVIYRFVRTDFVPVPGVEVVMLRLRKRGPPLVAPGEEQLYRDFVVYGFTAWRPSLRLAYEGVLDRTAQRQARDDAGVDWETTPKALSFEQWLELYRCFRGLRGERWQAASGRTAGAEARLREQQARLKRTHRTRTRPLRRRGTVPRGAE